jgi:hypothetical protein
LWPPLVLIGPVVSEEKIFEWKVYDGRTEDGRKVMALKTTMFQEIPFNSIRGESPTKTLPTNSRTGQKHYTLRNFVAWSIWRRFWSGYLSRSYAPLNLENSKYILLKQFVIASSLQLLNGISLNLVAIMDIICRCA